MLLNKIKQYVKIFLSKIPIKIINYVSNIVFINFFYKRMKQIRKFKTGESGKHNQDANAEIWNFIIKKIGRNTPIDFIEFGSYQGRSVNYFAKEFTNRDSTFIGFDSFEGLPDTDFHLNYKKGMFNLSGKIPTINDNRIKFVKGYFSEIKKEIKDELFKSKNLKLIHFDADIYSSTLLALFLCADYENYFCIFDEFGDDEARALYHYLSANNSSVDFIAASFDNNFYLSPKVVFAKISKN